jgi:hypothetical protein
MKSNRRTNSEGDDDYEEEARMSSRDSSLNQIDEQDDTDENMIEHQSIKLSADAEATTVSFDLMSDDDDDSESDYSENEIDDDDCNQIKSSPPATKFARRQFSSLSKLYISNDNLHVRKRQPHIIYFGVEPSNREV